MKNLFIVYGFLALMAAACGSGPAQGENNGTPSVPAAVVSASASAPVVVEEQFDASTITQEEFDHTMIDVRAFIVELNGIVRRRDYDGWVAHLSPSYFQMVNSPAFLLRISQTSERLRTRNIVLLSARDYFMQVVVPSRTDDRIDDIEFISRTRVKAFTLNPKGQRLRLYELENLGSGWRIVN
ncbi:MAG: hypothetical protein LBC88_05680 [Spirochaetaceae bacterium]|jgi:hypothetical protein|nr:hypothetical protein [Spirochaetaceae bacterium]